MLWIGAAVGVQRKIHPARFLKSRVRPLHRFHSGDEGVDRGVTVLPPLCRKDYPYKGGICIKAGRASPARGSRSLP